MSQGCIDVWVVNLLAERANLNAYKALLSEAERVKFAQFKNPKQAEYFAIVRAVQRRILAKYLAIDPLSIRFEKGIYGKPGLADQEFFFNVSHSADCLLLAISAEDEVGIDVELLKERGNLSSLIARCFTGEEQKYWRALPDSNKLEFFYRFWVAKEAFVKAVGRGIALGMSNCELSLPSLEGFCAIPELYGLADSWSLSFLDVDAAYLAAVVSKTGVTEINLRCYAGG